MKKELHLFIIWENARNKEKEILEDIRKEFEIKKIYDLKWSEKNFSSNLSRFYGTNLPKGSGKEEHCGNGRFLLIIVQDNSPVYKERQTSKGPQVVNINMFDKKEEYRRLTGGGHKVHATNNEVETNHDLTLLLDKNIEDFLKAESICLNGNEEQNKNLQNDGNKGKNEIINKLDKDLFGADGWNTVGDMFYALNNCTEYAILRNYEVLPEEIYVNEHNDIDLICASKDDAAYVLNTVPVFEEEYRVHHKTAVEGKTAFFDLRYVGDNYYCESLEQRILKNRVYNEKGFYVLNKEDYFYTLTYHAAIQKPEFRQDYKDRLKKMIEDIKDGEQLRISLNNTKKNEDEWNVYLEYLKKWMIQNEYIIEVPIDKTVMINEENAKKMGMLLYNYGQVLRIKELTEKNVELKNVEKLLNKKQVEIEEQNKIIAEMKEKIEGILDSRSWKLASIISKIKKHR